MESTMTLSNLLKAFKPIATPARLPTDPKLRRRTTFLKSVQEQLALLDNPELTRPLKVKGETRQQKIRPWHFQTPDGVVLAPRFGVRPLELAPGCTALKVGADHVNLKKALEALGAAASAGELDNALEAALPKATPKAKPGGKGQSNDPR
jgi:hypothetical protein